MALVAQWVASHSPPRIHDPRRAGIAGPSIYRSHQHLGSPDARIPWASSFERTVRAVDPSHDRDRHHPRTSTRRRRGLISACTAHVLPWRSGRPPDRRHSQNSCPCSCYARWKNPPVPPRHDLETVVIAPTHAGQNTITARGSSSLHQKLWCIKAGTENPEEECR
jgi:hypothetical protein